MFASDHPHTTESRFLHHTNCPACGSKDNLGVYDDGHKWCFGCGYSEPSSDRGSTTRSTEEVEAGRTESTTSYTPLRGTVSAVPGRQLDYDTCKKYDYQVGKQGSEDCHIANYRDNSGNIVFQKIRKAGKNFSTTGSSKGVSLFGQHLFSSGKYLCITEGEIDCLTVSQLFGNKYPVVSIPLGAQNAVKAIQAAYEWLDGFETIVLMFDQDEPGKKAVAEVAEILPPGKVKIASLPLKDPNECLLAGMGQDVIKAFWEAKAFRPDGIVMASDLREVLQTIPPMGLPYPYPSLNSILRGIRPSELVTITSGSGMGKTTFCRELAYHIHHTLRQPVGLIMLEESNRKTLEGIIGIHMDKNIAVDRTGIEPSDVAKSFDDLFQYQDIALYDHFGSTEVDNIINRIRYMAKACGVKFIFLDHLSILVSGLATFDERKMIDIAMTKLRTLVQETGITLFVVSHLKRPQGDRGHEDGAEVHLGQLRGSHSIAQLSDACIGLQKLEDTVDAVETVILKNRFTGEQGKAGILIYNRETGRLKESAF